MKWCGKVFFNHDGGIDDFVSLFLLLQMENVKVIGVGVTPADCYLEPAVSASRKIIGRFGRNTDIKVAKSRARGKNPFPKEWRMDAFYVDALPILNEFPTMQSPMTKLAAHQFMIHRILECDGPITLIFTGPLTDLAMAITREPAIVSKIERLVWTGGTFTNVGNVNEPNSDGTAEWNSFWDPTAVKTVWKSTIPIELVALESVKKIPLTDQVKKQWAKMRKNIGMDFMGQCMAIAPPNTHFQTNATFALWDALTISVVSNPSLVRKKEVKSIVRTHGSDQGRLEQSEVGRPVSIIDEVDRERFYAYIAQLGTVQE
ncbi:nucleoside hydrolase [Virgibacillus sp. 179-BFC.A HS]|uniref:Nucleoside hydrolase n=1 Tax=Tigheibacillus jepli TaxID=3035914 RepID=A0ABU5CHA4_9BACI|nr:nucleoside hydrolase [Virgibacillus sp. 179-BFC.A HS]MDY0404920.1 nucleoside hydrolase [Virgibacillus sp. 179-BFC.A HS]